MPNRTIKDTDPLEDFDPREITLNGVTKRVYVIAVPLILRFHNSLI